MDVGAWLKNLGFRQYEAVFRDNAIDGEVLPSLTAEDLKDLGVTIVGHRRGTRQLRQQRTIAPCSVVPNRVFLALQNAAYVRLTLRFRSFMAQITQFYPNGA